MSLLLLRCRNIQSSLWSINVLQNTVKGCSSEIEKRKNQTSAKANMSLETKSKLFPEYKPVYIFSRIRYLSLVHRTKNIATVIIPSSIILSGGLSAANLISMNIMPHIFFSVALLLWIHIIPYFRMNNVVCIVYYDETKSKGIISYINYWGTRKNVFVDPKNVVPIIETPQFAKLHIYKKLNIKSPELALKIHLGPAAEMDADGLRCVIGRWE